MLFLSISSRVTAWLDDRGQLQVPGSLLDVVASGRNYWGTPRQDGYCPGIEAFAVLVQGFWVLLYL